LAPDGEFLQEANEGNEETNLPSEIHIFVTSVSFCEISVPAAGRPRKHENCETNPNVGIRKPRDGNGIWNYRREKLRKAEKKGPHQTNFE
jgi:hypothetical protein